MSLMNKLVVLFLIMLTNINTILLTLQFASFDIQYYMPEHQPFPYREYLWLMSLGAITIGSLYCLFKFFVQGTFSNSLNKSIRRRMSNV